MKLLALCLIVSVSSITIAMEAKNENEANCWNAVVEFCYDVKAHFDLKKRQFDGIVSVVTAEQAFIDAQGKIAIKPHALIRTENGTLWIPKKQTMQLTITKANREEINAAREIVEVMQDNDHGYVRRGTSHTIQIGDHMATYHAMHGIPGWDIRKISK